MDLPRLCILTDDVIGPSQGTGALLMRQFGAYPRNRILNVALQPSPDPCWCESMQWNKESPVLREVLWLLKRRRISEAIQLKKALQINLNVLRKVRYYNPDLILAVVWSPFGFKMVEYITKHLKDVPLYLNIWDFITERDLAIEETNNILSKLVQRAVRIDCISDELSKHIYRLYSTRAVVSNVFCVELPAVYRTQHKQATGGLQPVVAGNMWQKGSLQIVDWLCALAVLKNNKHMQAMWYAHPNALKVAGVSSSVLPSTILFAGRESVTSMDLLEKYASCDFCLIPFHDWSDINSSVVHYSIPSRISEVCACGLPSFVVSEPNTALAAYVRKHGIGDVVSPKSKPALITAYFSFMEDHSRRAEYGRQARILAENTYELSAFQKRYYNLLANIVRD